jgi:hypothetical protein
MRFLRLSASGIIGVALFVAPPVFAAEGPQIGGVGFLRFSATEDDAGAGFDEPDSFDVAEVKVYLKGDLGTETAYKILYSVRHDMLWDAFLKHSPGPVTVTAGQFKAEVQPRRVRLC